MDLAADYYQRLLPGALILGGLVSLLLLWLLFHRLRQIVDLLEDIAHDTRRDS